MENFSDDFVTQPLVFKMPVGSSSEQDGVDLKWLSEEQNLIGELLGDFWKKYNNMVKEGKYPPHLLKTQFKIIESLANYQMALVEQQSQRKGVIQSESDVQEMMGQLENFVKMFRGDGKA